MKDIIYEKKSLPFYVSTVYGLSPIPHIHKEIELIYVIHGNATAYIDQKPFGLKDGDLIISFPNQIHFYEDSTQGEYLLIIVNPDFVYGLTDIMYDNIPKSNLIKFSADNEVFKLFSAANSVESEYKKTIVSGFVNQAFGLLMPTLELKPRSKTDNSTLQTILKYCSSNFTSEITLDSVAQNLHMNKYHISHLFNDKLCISFSSYINLLRITKACDMLQETDKKIADISEEVGFGSIRSFNRSFIQTMDITPIKYRNSCK